VGVVVVEGSALRLAPPSDGDPAKASVPFDTQQSNHFVYVYIYIYIYIIYENASALA
jgi:hypothetical protein